MFKCSFGICSVRQIYTPPHGQLNQTTRTLRKYQKFFQSSLNHHLQLAKINQSPQLVRYRSQKPFVGKSSQEKTFYFVYCATKNSPLKTKSFSTTSLFISKVLHQTKKDGQFSTQQFVEKPRSFQANWKITTKQFTSLASASYTFAWIAILDDTLRLFHC